MNTSDDITLTVGTVVRLKSGGPRMTVTGLRPAHTDKDTGEQIPASVYCQWFTENQELTGSFFVPESLISGA